MRCSVCNRRVADCRCVKVENKTGRWPKGTWFQKRLQKLRLEWALNGKPPKGESGRYAIELVCIMVLGVALFWALWTHWTLFSEAIRGFHLVAECMRDVIECRSV